MLAHMSLLYYVSVLLICCGDFIVYYRGDAVGADPEEGEHDDVHPHLVLRQRLLPVLLPI